jgi:arylsulfatase A-like enzyme
MRKLLAVLVCGLAMGVQAQQARHNVIIFVADGLRRGSVTAEDMPAFMKVRANGVDFANSHSVFPTFTTANASAIATGHGLGDTGDYSNTIYPGTWLAKPDPTAATGTIVPFLENDELLADMNSTFNGNYLGERTLLSMAKEKGFNVAAIGKIGPTGIQQIESVVWDDFGNLSSNGAIVIDDSTGQANGFPLSPEIVDALNAAKLPLDAPLRTNGFGESSQWNNGFSGDAQVPGTLAADRVQQQWLADVTTKVVLPKFAEEKKPFVLLFWSRDPDATQHNQGDSLQNLSPGINGDTSKLALRNADHCLKQLLDWLDANPAIKENTDVVVTSDHGFATISRREVAQGTVTSEPSAALTYELAAKEKPEPMGTLPAGFLAVDLGLWMHLRVFDPAVRATAGSSVYQEVVLSGERSQHPTGGSALLGESVKRVDGSDAQIIVAANGGADLLYVPSGSAETVHQAVATLAQLDYVGGIFVDDRYCASPADCAGALAMSAVGLVGTSKVPRPAIAVSFKRFTQRAGDLQSVAQVSDTTLQEGQGMHGGFGREQTLNNMAAMGPDFKHGYVDELPMGNIDIVPTLAHLLGFEMPAVGTLKGRVVEEALAQGKTETKAPEKTMVSAPAGNGLRTLLEYQVKDGVAYYDQACLVKDAAAKSCPQGK